MANDEDSKSVGNEIASGVGASSRRLQHAKTVLKHAVHSGLTVFSSGSPEVKLQRKKVAERCFERWGGIPEELQEQLLQDLFQDSGWILIPSSRTARYWDLVMLVVMVYTGIVTPFDVAFLPAEASTVFWLNRVTDLAFLLDIVANFFRTHKVRDKIRGGIHSEWQMDLSKIRWHYIRNGLVMDLVALLSSVFEIYIVVDGTQAGLKLVRAGRLLRLTRLLKMMQLFDRFMERSDATFWVCEMIRSLLYLAVSSHVIACMWAYTGLQGQAAGEGNWLDVMAGSKGIVLGPEDPWSLYLVSIYWSFTTLTSIGYGDVCPVTLPEIAVAVVLMLVASGLWACFIGMILSAITLMDHQRNMTGILLEEFNTMSREFGLPAELKVKGRKYMTTSILYPGLNAFSGSLGSISSQLKIDIQRQVQLAAVLTIPFLAPAGYTAESHEFKTLSFELSQHLRQETHNAEEWIVPHSITQYVVSHMQARCTTLLDMSRLRNFFDLCDVKMEGDEFSRAMQRGKLVPAHPPPLTMLDHGVAVRRFKLRIGCWHEDAIVACPALMDLEIARAVTCTSVFTLEAETFHKVVRDGGHVAMKATMRHSAVKFALSKFLPLMAETFPKETLREAASRLGAELQGVRRRSSKPFSRANSQSLQEQSGVATSHLKNFDETNRRIDEIAAQLSSLVHIVPLIEQLAAAAAKPSTSSLEERVALLEEACGVRGVESDLV